MAGIQLSYWEGLFSGAMLVSGRVTGRGLPSCKYLPAKFDISHLFNEMIFVPRVFCFYEGLFCLIPDGYPLVNDQIAGWNIPIFNGKCIFNWSIFHCHVSLLECISLDIQLDILRLKSKGINWINPAKHTKSIQTTKLM